MNNNVQGGSTITQQLIKNRMLTTERTYKRKIQEAYLAMQLEKEYNKDQILEAYMNTIFLGESNYGVKAAAQDYFHKHLDELTLRESAMLAGITQYPYSYNPRRCIYTKKDSTPVNERTDKVLRQMYKAGYISKDEYENALNESVYVYKTSEVSEMYDMPYFVEYAVYDVITHFLA
jgi:penicillin-binding protein 1A